MLSRNKLLNYFANIPHKFFNNSLVAAKGLFGKLSSTTLNQVNLNQLLDKAVYPLFFLTMVKEVSAKSRCYYAFEPIGSGQNMLDYNSDDLPNMPNNLIKYCHMVLLEASEKYFLENYAQCVKDDEGGPLVNVSVELGKKITISFMDCFNQLT